MPFFETTDKKSKDLNMNGHGLGLNISHNIAKLMNGSLTVKSDYGKGSNFTLTINTLVSN